MVICRNDIQAGLAWLLQCLEVFVPKKEKKMNNRRKSLFHFFISVTYTGANNAVRQMFWLKYPWQWLYWKSTQIMVNYQFLLPKEIIVKMTAHKASWGENQSSKSVRGRCSVSQLSSCNRVNGPFFIWFYLYISSTHF